MPRCAGRQWRKTAPGAAEVPDAALATLNAAEPGAFAARYREVRGDAYYAKGDKAAALTEYRAAAAGSTAREAEADSLLDLKIADLAASVPPVSAPPASAPLPEPAK